MKNVLERIVLVVLTLILVSFLVDKAYDKMNDTKYEGWYERVMK